MLDETISKEVLLLRLVEKRRALWNNPSLENFVNLVYAMVGDTDKYCSSGSNPGWGSTTNVLLKGIGNMLYDWDMAINSIASNICI